MDFRPRLIGLLDYTGRLASITEHAVPRLADYRSVVFHEAELRNHVGIHHDLPEDDERVWLKIDRIPRRDPPPLPEDIQAWVTVTRDPYKAPLVGDTAVITVPRPQADALVLAGRAKAADVQPAVKPIGNVPAAELADVILRLENDTEAQEKIANYLANEWTRWAEEEKPRRDTIRIYETFFSLQQALETQAAERPLELVWGIGVARWKRADEQFDHPLVEQLVEIEIDTEDGSIRIRPRSAEPKLAIRAYQELGTVTGAAPLERFAREFFQKLGPENEFSPFNRPSFEPVLRQACSLLDAQGVYYPDHTRDPENRSVPNADSHLVITDTWTIYSRPRSANFILEDIERLKNTINHSEPDTLPGTARRLVCEASDSTPSTGLNIPYEIGKGLASRITEPQEKPAERDFYFPKPFNDEQVEIVKRLSVEDGVVVQGPPGTGKTHTIANIICHYMATGRRVLVISHGEAALTVLRDQIPDEVRKLAISLLSSERQGLKQLEQAVKVLANDVAQLSLKSLARTIDDAETRAIELKQRVGKIDAELQRWATAHLHRIGGETGILPMELARHVVEGRARYTWFEDRPSLKEQPQFDDADIAQLRTARRTLGDDLQYLRASLPHPNDLPDPTIIAAIHEDLSVAQSIAEKSRSGEIPPLSLSAENAVDRAEQLKSKLDLLVEALELQDATPWFAIVFELAKQFESRVETDLFKRVFDLLGVVSDGRREFLQRRVELDARVFENQDQLSQLRAALSRHAEGRSAFSLIGGVTQREAKSLYLQARINGSPLTSPEDAKTALSYIEWREKLTELFRSWNHLSEAIGVPPLEKHDESVSKWASDIRSKLILQIAAARDCLPTAMEELRALFPFGISIAQLQGIETARRAREALVANLSRQRLEASRAKLMSVKDRFSNSSGDAAARIRSFLAGVGAPEFGTTSEIAEEWDRLLRELRHIHSLSDQFSILSEVSRRIAASGATRWSEKLTSEPALGNPDELTPDDWRSAWQWAQKETFLKSIDGRQRLESLAKERHAATEELERKFREIVRDRTYLLLSQRLTDRVRAALVMFGSAIRQIGAGTGIRARRFRRDAREAMDNCYSAVPCWIMPTWRVSESLPAIPGSFDLVIIDEASQSDVLAAPAILRGKKVLVVGDDKQVSPVAVAVEERTILQLRHNYLSEQPFAAMMVPGRSLYDLMSAIFPSQRIMLKEHFRCVEPIIRFSAREFYDNQIRPLRIPQASERLDPPLIDVYVENGWKNGKLNLPEAEFIVDEIERIIADPAISKRSIGVVSLIGANQAQKIQNMLLSKIGEEAFLRHQIACGDSATFQGKERDIMFVSMVAGPNDTRALTGMIYEQRFNVALSRARDRMYLVRSVDVSMLKPHDLKFKVIHHFQNPMEGAAQPIENGISLCESDFEREVYQALVQRGWRVRPQVKAGEYRIDLVIEGSHDRRLAVELDGDKYHGPEKWTEDYNRQLALERMGWRFWRCWGSSWTLDPEDCLASLEATLRSVGIEPLGGEWQAPRYTEHRVVGRRDVPSSAQPIKIPNSQDGKASDLEARPEQQTAAFGNAEEIKIPALGLGPHTNGHESGTFLYEEHVIEPGDRVVIAYNDDPTNPKTLVLTQNPSDDPKTGVIYVGRPIAKALLGQSEQDIIELPTGPVPREAVILKVEKGNTASMSVN